MQNLQSRSLTLITLLLLAGGSRIVLTQSSPRRDTTTFVVTLVEMPVSDKRSPIVIVRRASTSPADVILINRSTASVKDLSSALTVMEQLHQRLGDNLTSDVQAIVTKKNTRVVEGFEKARMQGYLQALADGPVAYVKGVGRARAVTVRIPYRRFAGLVEADRK